MAVIHISLYFEGFNTVSEPKQKKVEKQPQIPKKISNDVKEKVTSKPRSKQEKKITKSMTFHTIHLLFYHGIT